MSRIEADFRDDVTGQKSSGWQELWLKEDWWAIWLGLGTVITGYLLFVNGSSLRWIAVTPAKWSGFSQLSEHFAANIGRYVVQFLLWLAVLSIALTALGYKVQEFIPAFTFLYLLSVVIFAIGQWDRAATYNLEPPLVALAAGLVLSNLVRLPRRLDAGFRVLGFLVASVIVTAVASDYRLADFNKTVNPAFVGPIKDLRTWAFIFCFFSIGLTTRFRELTQAGSKPFLAFSSGVAVNVVLGFVLSAVVFASYWTSLAP